MNRMSRTIMSVLSTKEIPLDPGIWSRTSRIQLMYGSWVTMANLAIGLAFGFSSVQVPQLSKPDSEIHITRSDASWIASMLLLFCPIGCMTSGFIMDRFGRRIMLISSQIAMFIGWIYTSLAKSSKHIIIARAITGIGCGMAMSPPRIYCTEISLPNIRGVLGAFPNTAQSIGISIQAALGAFFHWEILSYICCIVTLVNFFSFTFLPETPYFILQTRTTQDARISLMKFRGPNYNIEREMNDLIDFKEDNNIRKLTFKENMRALFQKSACKPFWLITIYAFLGQLAGNSIIMFWSIDLLKEAHSSFDVYNGNILLALTRVFMGIMTSILLYRFGRRSLALSSAIGVTLVCLTLGAFLIYDDEPSVLPQICLILYNVFASVGYYALPHLMAFELLPLQVRGILGAALVSLHCLMMFASTKMEPYMVDFLGVDYTFVTFGGFSLAAVVYLYFYLPETKDLTLQEIEEYYKEIRPTLVSQRRIILTKSMAAMQSRSKIKSSPKLNRTLSSKVSRTSKTSMAAKLEAKKQLAKFAEEGKSGTESTKSLGPTKSTDSLYSSDSKRSDASKKSRIIFNEQDEDVPSVKSTKSSVSKSILKDKKSKAPEESSTDDEETPKDKDKASTSKKNT